MVGSARGTAGSRVGSGGAGTQPAAARGQARAATAPGRPAVLDALAAGALPPLLGEPLAEAAVLGCVLLAGPDVARDVLHRLTSEDWTVPVHAHVAAAATVLLERGEPVDPVTVLGQLRRQGTEDARTASRDAGVLLVELCRSAPCTSSARHYVQIVLEHSYRRRVQQAAVRLLHASDAGSLHDLAVVIAREHAALLDCQQRIGATRPT